VKSKCATIYKCYYWSCGDLLGLYSGLQIFELKLANGLSWVNQGTFFVDLIHLGAYGLIELDIYAYIACYKMIEWINWLVIKFGLIWVG
jgi:hypothetical protein